MERFDPRASTQEKYAQVLEAILEVTEEGRQLFDAIDLVVRQGQNIPVESCGVDNTLRNVMRGYITLSGMSAVLRKMVDLAVIYHAETKHPDYIMGLNPFVIGMHKSRYEALMVEYSKAGLPEPPVKDGAQEPSEGWLERIMKDFRK